MSANVDDVNFTDFSKKVEIWSTDDKYEPINDPQEKVKKALKDSKEECIIVGQYSVEPDAFEELKKSSKCRLPLWLTFVIAFLGIMFVCASLGALLTATLAPKKYASYNENCDEKKICDPEKNLNCTNSVCLCSTTDLIWDSFNTKCTSKKYYGELCTLTSDCVDGSDLFCSKAPSGCNCPLTSISNMCDCQTIKYYDGNQKKCVNKVGYGANCNFDQQCLQGLNYACKSDGTCGCANTHYYSGSMCVSKSGFGNSCNALIPCDDTKGLICSSSSCDCNNGYYFDTILNRCSLLKTISESCAGVTECNAGQGLQCASGACRCASGFWSQGSLKCIVCSSPYQNSICLTPNAGTLTWQGAESACTSVSNYQLSVVSNNDEFSLLQSYLSDNFLSGSYWVGLKQDLGVYKWLDNTVMSTASNNWCTTEPNVSNDCVVITKIGTSYCLKTENCFSLNKYICKKIS